MKLGFDIDGIVAHMSLTIIEHINEKFNLNHTEDVLVNHQIFDNIYIDDPEKNREISDSIYENVIRNEEAILDLPTHENAVDAIKKLVRHGHSIHFITSRANRLHGKTVEWVRKNLIPFNTIHSVGKDAPQGNTVGKGRQARALNLDFFIDDDPGNLPDLYLYKKRWRKGVGLFTRPWNINEPFDDSRFIRFNEWNEVIRHLGIHKR